MRPEKNLLLNEIKEKIEGSTAMIVAKYDKVEPNLSWDFRSSLSKVGSDFEVVKKRIFIKAAAECGLDLQVSELKGNIGVVFMGENTIDSTKEFYKFNKGAGGLFEVLLGRYEDKIYTPSDVKELSKLPSRDEMRAQFIGLLEAPMSQTVSVMENLLAAPMHCLEQKSKESK